ncbi:adhesion G-protein coupled receptor G6 isoform X3 [Electrophorus electricus]|uniref:adhesion G-protein coupled receptor G6 isoform X3 n=1 Tax=Electrophorus electricus TaxID=8005 RepID=UPI0015D0936A|nr:adhesion G-protein coupled receptor G6 isoform X3 [Electrophorus electricus]
MPSVRSPVAASSPVFMLTCSVLLLSCTLRALRVSYISGRWWRWKFRNVLAVVLLLICVGKSAVLSAVLSCHRSCHEVLTTSEGIFTSPCYPSDYLPSQSCSWTLQAPTGFIVQITFLDFELEEAQGCIYDRVVVNTGQGSGVPFCGLTANGLSLNSSGNVMVVSFISDFSVQKKGFSINYRQVAVALRNQKVTVPQNSKDVVKVSSSVPIPILSEFTMCFEISRLTLKGTEVIFSYTETGKGPTLSLGSTGNTMELTVGGSTCPVSELLAPVDITSQLQLLCLTWSTVSGRVAVNFRGNYRAKVCLALLNVTVASGGSLMLGAAGGTGRNFDGIIYNFRLWAVAMSFSNLSALTCDAVGNVVDWDNGFWDIPSSSAQTDTSLSCSTSTPATTSQSTRCPPGLGCTALSTTISYTTTPSVSLITTSVQTTPSTTTSNTPAYNLVRVEGLTTTTLAGSTLPVEAAFYRISLSVMEHITDDTMTQWFNQTFQNWNYTVYVRNVSVHTDHSSTTSTRYTCKALLMYINTTGKILTDSDIEKRLRSASAGELLLGEVTVDGIENCQAEENPFHYKWPESRASVTQYIPCFPYKEQNASRTCLISSENYTSFWDVPDLNNCKDIEDIDVSDENAAEVAVQLVDITNNELSTVEVSKVVTMVKKLVNVARINATLASSVVAIISNVMISSDSAQLAASETALKTMDELVQKIEFDGPSLTITSKNLAVGISTLNISDFNGTTFSAYIPANSTDPQINFESEIQNPLASVKLPATLLINLSNSDMETVSRINFMFFSRTGLFRCFGSLMEQQSDGLSLSSYVVASSVGNLTISNLRDPVRIEISHLQYQWNPKPLCVFWDFTLKSKYGTGGWNREGCMVDPESNSNRTVCLCNHLTHFGVLMDISGAAAQIDEKNTKILTFITYIGCGISAIFTAVTILTYIAFEKLRRDYPSKILMNLSSSLLFLNMVFLLDGWLASSDTTGLCVAVAVFLHFFLLTSFTWMGLESLHMYIALVKVFNTYIRRYILKFCIVGWGLPAVVVGIVVAIDKDFYGKEYYAKGESGHSSSEFCWIKNKVVFYVTCVVYFSVIFLMNVAMFIVVMMQICGRSGKRSNRTLRDEVLRNLRSVVSLTFLLGLTWGFAFFAWGPVNLAFIYLFSIFNSLQGLFIFIFHCALKENVQKQWRRYLCCGKLHWTDNSDWSKTATNNTKKVSSDNLGKSLSSSSFCSTTANWTSKAKATLNPFAKHHSSAGKGSSGQSSPTSTASACPAGPGQGEGLLLCSPRHLLQQHHHV